MHTGYLENGNSKGDARGRSEHRNHSKRVLQNMGRRNVGTIRGKIPNKANLALRNEIVTTEVTHPPVHEKKTILCTGGYTVRQGRV